MAEWLPNLGIALVSLLGTLIVAYLGYRQWRLTRHDSSREPFVNMKHQVYERLWRLVEETHVDLRTDANELDNFKVRLARVNSFILENEVYLAEGDYDLVNQYLQALREMIAWVRTEGDEASQDLLEATGALPREATAAIRAQQLRQQLKQRVTRALAGG